MNAPRIDEDLTTIEHLDFEPGCDYRDACTSEAKWSLELHSTAECRCAVHYLACDSCRARFESLMAGIAPASYRHRPCGRVFIRPGDTSLSIVIDRIEPLR